MAVSGLRGTQLLTASANLRRRSVIQPTPPLSPCRHLVPSESAQRLRLSHRHGPAAGLNPASSLETAQRGIDALPGAPDLTCEVFLAQSQLYDPVVTPGLAEQHLRDASRQVQEN